MNVLSFFILAEPSPDFQMAPFRDVEPSPPKQMIVPVPKLQEKSGTSFKTFINMNAALGGLARWDPTSEDRLFFVYLEVIKMIAV